MSSASLAQILPGKTAEAEGSHTVNVAALFVVVLSIFGYLAARIVLSKSLSEPTSSSDNVFFRLYVLNEPPLIILTAVFALLTLVTLRIPTAGDETVKLGNSGNLFWPAVAGVAVAVCALTWLGHHFLMHGALLAMDEFAAAFQSRILAHGQLQATVAPQWEPYVSALTPVFVTYKPEGHVWLSSYLPGYAGIRALFFAAGAESLTNSVLAGLSIFSLAKISRQLWPEDRHNIWLAVVFLATSSQFLFMSMSSYSMPAHLCLNLFWLYLYTRPGRAGMIAAPWVGVLALGLHSPFPHAFFVAPFLLRILRRKQRLLLLYFVLVYASGAAVWYNWLVFSHPMAAGGGLLNLFRLPGIEQFFVQGMNLTLAATWQGPIIGVLLVVALFRWRELGEIGRDLVLGVALVLGFYTLYNNTQGHGWGYRYLYGVLGNVVLLAVMGYVAACKLSSRTRMLRLIWVSVALTVFVQTPLRAVQVERFVRPFARSFQYLAALPQEVVVVDSRTVWYGRDLIRNDPFLDNEPKIMTATALTAEHTQALKRRFGSGIRWVSLAELERMGLDVFPPSSRDSDRAAP